VWVDYNADTPNGIKSWAMIIVRRLTVQGLLVGMLSRCVSSLLLTERDGQVLDHISKMGEFLQWAVPKVREQETSDCSNASIR
jgi:hypothetical protein